MNEDAPEGQAVPASLMPPVILLLLQTCRMSTGADYDLDERNISVVICDTNIA
jgi:hypothetical protein